MSQELENTIGELSRAFTDFKKRHDERMDAEVERIDELQKKVQRPGYSDPDSNAVKGGKSLDGDGSVKVYTPEQKVVADAPKSEHSDIDLGNFLRAAVDKPRNGKERELLQEKGVGSDQYELPVWISSELIDRLRASNPLLSAGARTLTIEGGETKFIGINSDPNAVWHAELTEESLTDPAWNVVSMEPKTLMSLTQISRELLQDSVNVSQALTSAFVGSINDAILTATFGGATTNGPTGLSSLVTQTEEYANAGTPDWGTFVKASRTLHDNNVPGNGRSFIHSPDIWESMALISDDNGRYQDAPSFIRDVPNITSSGVPAGVAYAGDMSNVVYGYRMNFGLEKMNVMSSYSSIWVATARLDIATFRPNALVRIEEAAA